MTTQVSCSTSGTTNNGHGWQCAHTTSHFRGTRDMVERGVSPSLSLTTITSYLLTLFLIVYAGVDRGEG